MNFTKRYFSLLWLFCLPAESALAVPHNGSLSDGRRYALLDSNGKPLDATSALRRNRNELLNEISQIKGQSDTPPEPLPQL
jgi:hypothetical protein